jgi:hypothetical protein
MYQRRNRRKETRTRGDIKYKMVTVVSKVVPYEERYSNQQT